MGPIVFRKRDWPLRELRSQRGKVGASRGGRNLLARVGASVLKGRVLPFRRWSRVRIGSKSNWDFRRRIKNRTRHAR